MRSSELVIRAPEWISEVVGDPLTPYPSPQERMRLVIALARSGLDHGGGPFAAAVFDAETWRLVAPGVNSVVPWRCSIAHAEIVAIVLAQQHFGTHDLGRPDLPALELVTSVEPCAMCLGAIPWSGIGRLICGAREEDARAIGFDEGDKPADRIEGLRRRGIVVTENVLRDEAAAVLRDYAQAGGAIYNGAPRISSHP